MTCLNLVSQVAALLFSLQALSQDLTQGQAQSNTAQVSTAKWSHESEVAIVTVDGNTDTESYSGKQKTTYTWSKNAIIMAGRYLETTSENVETAKLWELSIRYERSLSSLWSVYIGHGAESDHFNGYIQRDNSDLGAKYQILKTEKQNWVAEAGYRYSHIYETTGTHRYVDTGRLFSQYTYEVANNLSFKYWVEYLPNFDQPKLYFLNTEPSLNIMLTKGFSLKTAYLIKYQNTLISPNKDYVDTSFTTSLVAKF